MPVSPARRAVTVVLAALLIGAAGCSQAPIAGSPSAGSITATNDHVTTADLEKFFGHGLTYWDHGSFGVDTAALLTATDAPGGTMLRVKYPAGSASRRAEGEDGGTQVYLKLPGAPVDALYLQYSVRFPSGFDFVKGGKMPGLFGGVVNNGQNIPDGTDGFSTRYMWRTGGAGEVYAYLPTSQTHGTSLGRGCWHFTPGRWSSIQQRVRLNTPGQSNGDVTVWQDGRQVLSQTGLEFRTVDTLRIEGLFFSTFFGGGDTSWSTPVDQYADFADFAVSNTHIPPTAPSAAADDGSGKCGAASTP